MRLTDVRDKVDKSAHSTVNSGKSMNEITFEEGLVARLLLVACQGSHGVQEAGGSNPLTQTIRKSLET